MSLPLVAIVGRPNVGKSSLLNVLAGRRISIVDPTAGVTRDRVQALCEHEGIFFEVVDTGGYGIVDRDYLNDQVEAQIRYAVDQAKLIVFVVDAREGLLPLDKAVADWLRECDRPVLLVANKVDSHNMLTELGDFYQLGYGSPLAISALHHRGDEKVKEWIAEHLPGLEPGQQPAEDAMKLALVGRRNVGKSTLINALAGQERVIVSEEGRSYVRGDRYGRPAEEEQDRRRCGVLRFSPGPVVGAAGGRCFVHDRFDNGSQSRGQAIGQLHCRALQALYSGD